MDFMTTKELAELLQIAPGTLCNWRVQGYGPRFVKFGQRVLYRKDEVKQFVEESLQQNTAQNRRKK